MEIESVIERWKIEATVNLFGIYSLGAMHEPDAAEKRLITGLEKLDDAETTIRRVAETYLL